MPSWACSKPIGLPAALMEFLFSTIGFTGLPAALIGFDSDDKFNYWLKTIKAMKNGRQTKYINKSNKTSSTSNFTSFGGPGTLGTAPGGACGSNMT